MSLLHTAGMASVQGGGYRMVCNRLCNMLGCLVVAMWETSCRHSADCQRVAVTAAAEANVADGI